MKSVILMSLLVIPVHLLGQTCLTNGIVFSSQQAIDDFPTDYPNCTHIVGDVLILESIDGDITNVDSLNQVEHIEGYLIVLRNDYFHSLDGFSNLDSIGDAFIISRCDSLTTLDGLNNVESIGGTFSINNCNNLSSISSFSDLTSIGKDFVFAVNNNLTTLSGVENVGQIGGSLVIQQNPLLVDISALQNIDPLSIQSISSLKDIEIRSNNSLSNCSIHSICEALDLSGTSTRIQFNLVGCNSEVEIENACLALPVQWVQPLRASIKNHQMILNWSVAHQVNNNVFVIEESKDGVWFEHIGEVLGEPYAIEEKEYSYTHQKGFEVPVVYYRIKQIDLDGHFSYSNIEATRFRSAEGTVFVSPNPFSDYISVFSIIENEAALILDLAGRIIVSQSLVLGENSIETNRFDKGFYILKTSAGNAYLICKE